MIQILVWIGVLLSFYFFITLAITLILANLPRRPVDGIPDWGTVKDCRIPTVNGKTIEAWVVYPHKSETNNNKKPAIILIHGWGRNRARMISRARMYGREGYTTILISVRDHGNSDKEVTGMSILRFSQDLEACVEWWGKPVILAGHSIGAGSTLIVAGKNSLVKGVVAEAPPYAFPHSLKYVYGPILKWFTPLFMPGITTITLLKVRNHSRRDYSPLDAAKTIPNTVSTFLIHGKKDRILPWKLTPLLGKKIKRCEIWIPEESTHYDIEEHPDYEKNVINFIKSNFTS
ncbi:MAG: alpha/beta fold hydrolase [Candidatus Heimdallarchaeota archaeon]|nr:MAG: alpha/beta fold hydrolase [Candidatus Heimdallarchaeota archaeon]